MHQMDNRVYPYLFAFMCIYAYASTSVCMFIYIFIPLCTIFITHRVSFLSVCRNFSFYKRQSFPLALLYVHSNLTETSSCTLKREAIFAENFKCFGELSWEHCV